MRVFEKSLRRLGAGGSRKSPLSDPSIRTAAARQTEKPRADTGVPAAAGFSDEAERLSERLERDSRRYPAPLSS